VNVGVVGTGSMGSVHVELLRSEVSGATVVATADPFAPGADHADGLELIADASVDAVVIASPPETHEALVLACLAAGKRVLCEKPLADTLEACRRIAAADADGLLTVGFMRRRDPGYAGLKQRLDAGEIGVPVAAHMVHRNASSPAWFTAGHVLTDSLVHEADVTRWLLGEEIARVTVFAIGDGLSRPQLVVLETASGRVVDVECFVNAGYGYDIRCEVVGEAGTLELPGRPGVVADFRRWFGEAYRRELQAWADGEPGPTAFDGYAATAVCAAAVESLREGRPADVRL
jgi:myo-inositol 2-dehydrogenase / D-chiro-inositol 1-dehydrogenase